MQTMTRQSSCGRRTLVIETCETRRLLSAESLEFGVDGYASFVQATFDPWADVGGYSWLRFDFQAAKSDPDRQVPALPEQPSELTFEVVRNEDFAGYQDGKLQVGDQVGFLVNLDESLEISTPTVSLTGPDGQLVSLDLHGDIATQVVSPIVVNEVGTYRLQLLEVPRRPIQAIANVDLQHEATTDNDSIERATPIDLADLQSGEVVTVARVKSPAWNEVLHVNFNDGNFPDGSQITVSNPDVSVDVQPRILGHSLVIETVQDPSGTKLEGQGLLLNYDSLTGNLSLETRSALLTTIEIKSKSGLFRGVRQPVFDENPFNVFEPGKLFVLSLSGDLTTIAGFPSIDFGAVLPTNMTYDALLDDLTVSGSRLLSGGLLPVSLIVDDDRSTLRELIGTSSAEVFVPFESSVATRLSFDYQLTSLEPEQARDVSLAHSIRLVYRDESRPSEAQTLMPCEYTCTAHLTVDAEIVGFVLKSAGAGTRLVAKDIDVWIDESSRDSWFSIDVSPNQAVRISEAQYNTFSSLALLDAEGDVVVNGLRSAVVESSQATTYYLVYGADRGSFDEDVSVERFRVVESELPIPYPVGGQPWRLSSEKVDWAFSLERVGGDEILESYQYRAAHRDGVLSIYFSQPYDRRTCTPDAFLWNGQPLRNAVRHDDVQQTTHGFRFEFSQPLSIGEHSVELIAGTCRDTRGNTPVNAEQALVVDYTPPVLVDVSLETTPWLPPGAASLVLRYDEEVYVNLGVPNDDSVSGSYLETPQGTVDVLRSAQGDGWQRSVLTSSGGFVFVDLGELAPGEYRLYTVRPSPVEYWHVSDRHGSQTVIPPLDLAFTVSETAPPSVGSPDVFDLDRNGNVDEQDLALLSSAVVANQDSLLLRNDATGNWQTSDLERTGSIFDLNNDGRLDIKDEILMRVKGLGMVIGDVNRDGKFDDADLALLGEVEYGTKVDWDDGDYNGDGAFDSADLVHMFQTTEFRS